jgi:hypothetical protein
MRTTLSAVLLGAALLTGACAEVEGAVDQASDRANEVVETARYCAQALQVAQAVSDQDVDAAVTAGEELVEVAPPEIADDARILLDAATRAQDGDTAALQDEEVVAAAERLRTTTEETCSPGT